MIRKGAFVTKSVLLRAAAGAAFLMPGLTMRGFSDLEQGRAFIAAE
jgi:hypothetical protein